MGAALRLIVTADGLVQILLLRRFSLSSLLSKLHITPRSISISRPALRSKCDLLSRGPIILIDSITHERHCLVLLITLATWLPHHHHLLAVLVHYHWLVLHLLFLLL